MLPHHLYIHIPFCRHRCVYCDFNTYASMEHRIDAYVDALCTELRLLSRLSHPVSPPSRLPPTIFIGGGTPSLLTLAQLARILQAASECIALENAEISMEANPGSVLGDVTDGDGAGIAPLTYFQGLRSLGINRLSLGVQSLHDPTLQMLGRIHTAHEAHQCFAWARRAGFDNINLDVMFDLPGQTPAQWETTLNTLLTWEAEHLALYQLILEEPTPLYAQVLHGGISLPDNDTTATMYEYAMQCLAAASYHHYEISNWARGDMHQHREEHCELPAAACQHNLAYWLNSNYLAAGAGAHGHLYPQRYANLMEIDAYIAAVQQGQRPVADVIELTPHDLAAETMFMGLRLHSGVSYAHFRERCGADLDAVYGTTLADLEHLGLLERDAVGVRLSTRGRMLGNQVFARFVG